ncbi:MAG TPA: hypothetical protein VM143_12145 [Acidimicrobiales bacterium]|nr:hypothetical protein [Acidimicrobiales bacterium]
MVLVATPAGAHPLGNFTVNTATALTVSQAAIDVTLVVDMAEIPALQARQRMDLDGDKVQSLAEQGTFRRKTCSGLIADLNLQVEDRTVVLDLAGSGLAFPPGQAGLTTLRLRCDLRASVTIDRPVAVVLRSMAFADRVGWREVTAAADGVTFRRRNVALESPSDTLTNYPTELLRAPLRQDRASLIVIPGGPALVAGGSAQPSSPLPRGIDGPTRAFASFVGRHDLSVGVALVAIALSLLLGAIHALAPGHGKTVMAAYLVGQKGSLRQAATLGLTVTATHTLGVLALGVAIAASKVVTPERLYPYLGAVSGLLLAAIGFNLLRNARGALALLPMASEATDPPLTDGPHHDHDLVHRGHHEHEHEHERSSLAVTAPGSTSLLVAPRPSVIGADAPASSDAGGWHAHGGSVHRHAPIVAGQSLTWSSLLALGFVGGFLPSPSAVVVLLGAIALGRTWFGVLLVIAYGAGMAGTLMGAGLLLVRARGTLERRLHRVLDRGGSRVVNTFLPVGTALVIIVVGLGLAAQGVRGIGG